MIITRLSLKNFGVYAGVNTFKFENKKPVVLIAGMNGRGKTTFLEAVLLALYGANSFAYMESNLQSYGQYLMSYVNKSDGTLSSYVELEFKLELETEEFYLIRREWSGAGKRAKEQISVRKNGEDNQFLADNWSMFIENILPSGLSSFFFFDGEKIAELAVDRTNKQIKQSIKSLLGISVLDMLGSDISRIAARVKRRSDNEIDIKEQGALSERKEAAEKSLQILDDEIEELSISLEKTRKKLEKAKMQYSAKGGDMVTQREGLQEQKSLLKLKLEQSEEQLLEAAAGTLPLSLVTGLLGQIYSQSEREHEVKYLGSAMQQMNKLFVSYSEKSPDDGGAIREFINYVEQHTEQERTDIIYNISDQVFYQLGIMLEEQIPECKRQAERLMHNCIKYQSEMNEIDNYLSVDIDENVLSVIYVRIMSLEQEIMELEVKLNYADKKRASLNGEAIKAASEYNRYVESLLQRLELYDDSDRILKYSNQALIILEEYKIRLQSEKIGVLAQTITDCYKKLSHKKELIEKIVIDPVTLDFTYFGADSEPVPSSSLSAGEKQLMVISLLWALAICSRRKLPVIIDTPLSRLDSNHRTSLIENYFPQAGDQVIILSTDSEIDSYYYKMMKKNVGDEFTLCYDDNTRSSTVKSGYFMGGADNDKAN